MILFKYASDEIITDKTLKPFMHKEMNYNCYKNVKPGYHKESVKDLPEEILVEVNVASSSSCMVECLRHRASVRA